MIRVQGLLKWLPGKTRRGMYGSPRRGRVRPHFCPELERLEDRTLPAITPSLDGMVIWTPSDQNQSVNKMWWTDDHSKDVPPITSNTGGKTAGAQVLGVAQGVAYNITGTELAVAQQPAGLVLSEQLGLWKKNTIGSSNVAKASAAFTVSPGRLPGNPSAFTQPVRWFPPGFLPKLNDFTDSTVKYYAEIKQRGSLSSGYVDLTKDTPPITTSIGGNSDFTRFPPLTNGPTYANGWAALGVGAPSQRFHVYTVAASADASTLTVSLGNTTGYTLQYASDSALTDTPDGSGVTWADASLTNVIPDANGVFDAGTDSPTWWGLSDGSPSDPGIVLSAASSSNAPLVPAGTTPITEDASTIGGGPIATWLFFQTPTGPASLIMTVTPTTDQQQGGGTAPSHSGGGGRGGLAASALDAGLGAALARAEATTGQFTFGVSDPASTARGPGVIQVGIGASPGQHDPVSTTGRSFGLPAGDHLSGTDTAVGDAIFGLPDGSARDFGLEHSGS